MEFSLEAKCYGPENGVGVRDISRLVSRIRHRQFGVFVTTSYVADQAYSEVRHDGHPIVVLAARDIANILKAHGAGTPTATAAWVEAILNQTPGPYASAL